MSTKLTTRVLSIGLSAALLLTFGCNRNNDDGVHILPRGAAPVWGPTIHNEMLTIIEQLDSFHVPPLETLPPVTARMQKTIFDAAAAVAQTYGIQSPVYTVDATDRSITIPGATLQVRIYTPHNATGPFAGIVYYHGGGWVIATNQTYDASSRSLAEETGAVVVSVEYRKGPEAKFPTAHKDAFQAYKWVLANAASLNIDANRMGVAGESAGANLACNVSISARDSNITRPKHQLLIYPVAQSDTTTASYVQYGAAKPLNMPLIKYFLANYLNNMSEATDPRISLVNANLAGLPSTTIINADIDPLRDDGLQLEAKLKAANVSVTRKIYDGVTHEFYGMNALLPEARDAHGVASAAMRLALQ